MRGLTRLLSKELKLICREVEVYHTDKERGGGKDQPREPAGWYKGIVTKMMVEFKEGEFVVGPNEPYRFV